MRVCKHNHIHVYARECVARRETGCAGTRLGEGLRIELRLAGLAVLAEGGGAGRQRRAAAEALECDLCKPHEAAEGRRGRAHVDRTRVLPCTSHHLHTPAAPGMHTVRMHGGSSSGFPHVTTATTSAVHSVHWRGSPRLRVACGAQRRTVLCAGQSVSALCR